MEGIAWTLMEGFVWTLALVFAGLWPIFLLHSWATKRKRGTPAKILKYITWGFAFIFGGVLTIESLECRMESMIVAVLLWWIAIGLVGLGVLYSAVHLLWIMPLAFTISWNLWRMDSHTRLYARIGSLFVKSAFFLGIAIGAVIYWNRT